MIIQTKEPHDRCRRVKHVQILRWSSGGNQRTMLLYAVNVNIKHVAGSLSFVPFFDVREFESLKFFIVRETPVRRTCGTCSTPGPDGDVNVPALVLIVSF